MMAPKQQDPKATVDVSEVTSIDPIACLNARLNLSIGLFLIALIWNVFFQLSWKTKISSDPIPIIMMKTLIWKDEK